ncbi:hypothetical protein ACFYNO_23755 [Kitasatospora sp. NPDC006697]|uniref:hypothetical protein n=1 Tax=Kitasatospora sp. NPDC006697 TaxID=3364020 RepID=UPI00369D07A4
MTATALLATPLRNRRARLESATPKCPAAARRSGEPVAVDGRFVLGTGERLRQARLDIAARRAGFLLP